MAALISPYSFGKIVTKELYRSLKDKSAKLKRELAEVIKEEADQLAAEIKSEAPFVTGKLRDSVVVKRGRNTLDLVVTAGGDTTTTNIQRTATYEREVKTGSGDTQGIARGGSSGVTYDYALAVEFGTSRQAAQPFFYSVYRRRREGINARIEQAVTDIMGED